MVDLVRTLVLFHYDDDARRVQSQFDGYLRVISDSFNDIWTPATIASPSSAADMVQTEAALLILPTEAMAGMFLLCAKKSVNTITHELLHWTKCFMPM